MGDVLLLNVNTMPQQPTVDVMGVLIKGGTVPTPVGPTGGCTPERVVGLASWLPFFFLPKTAKESHDLANLYAISQ